MKAGLFLKVRGKADRAEAKPSAEDRSDTGKLFKTTTWTSVASSARSFR